MTFYEARSIVKNQENDASLVADAFLTAMSCFLLKFAELGYQRQHWKESEEKLNEAMDYQNKVRIVFIWTQLSYKIDRI